MTLVPAIFQVQRELAGSRGLARSLQTGHHHDRRTSDQRETDFASAEEVLQLVADDFGDLLRRRKCGQHAFANRFFADPDGEFLDDFEIDVGLQQRDADFLEGVVDVPLIERGLAAQSLEDSIHPVLEVVEHSSA